MPDRLARAGGPLYWPIADLKQAYSKGELRPTEVLDEALERLSAINPKLNAFIGVTEALARSQADAADQAYRAGTAGPLAGIPVSIKDTFDIAAHISTRGSLVFRNNRAAGDSGAVARLRAAGAVFVGKTNTAEFGQSATTDNRLGDECVNPWDTARTPGGSSGGGAASVAAGIVTAALAADGGGSIRIPAAFCGLFGIKPTFGACKDEGGFRAMSDFCCPGPLAWRVADAREVLEVLSETPLPRRASVRPLRIAWCPSPDDRPVNPGVAAVVAGAVRTLEDLGHRVTPTKLPLDGWAEAFGPLVLEEEGRERGHLLREQGDLLTRYEASSLEAALRLTPQALAAAREHLGRFRARIHALFENVDVIATPTTAVTAFPIGQRPKTVDGKAVDWLWGAFPFTAPYNVAQTPAVSIPCGFHDGLPVGLQLVGALGRDLALLNLSEELEQAFALDRSRVVRMWSRQSPATKVSA